MSHYFERVNKALSAIDADTLSNAINEIIKRLSSQNSIFIAGNGGSAAIASHFATDLIKAGYRKNQAVKAFSLSENTAILTATSNDFGYEHIFSWQLSQIAQSGDLLISISSSGNSQNIINALEFAKKNNITTLSLSGFDGGISAKISDIVILTKSEKGDYGPVEDAHSIICHYIASKIK